MIQHKQPLEKKTKLVKLSPGSLEQILTLEGALQTPYNSEI